MKKLFGLKHLFPRSLSRPQWCAEPSQEQPVSAAPGQKPQDLRDTRLFWLLQSGAQLKNDICRFLTKRTICIYIYVRYVFITSGSLFFVGSCSYSAPSTCWKPHKIEAGWNEHWALGVVSKLQEVKTLVASVTSQRDDLRNKSSHF